MQGGTGLCPCAIPGCTRLAERIEHHLLGEDFRQDDRLTGAARRVNHVEGDPDPSETREGRGDFGVGIGPVGFHGSDAGLFEGLADGGPVNGGALVEFPRDAPVGGEIKEDAFAVIEEGVEGFLGEWLPGYAFACVTRLRQRGPILMRNLSP